MIKKLLLVMTLAVAAFGQHAWNCFPDATLSEDVYWNHQPTAVRELRNAQDDTQRSARAVELAAQGFVIDVPIMVWRWSAVCTMGVRKLEGFTWVPSALQAPIPVAPGLSFPGLPSYDPDHPPAGSIKVSTDAADYPPADVPVVAPSVPTANVIGVCYQGDGRVLCALGPGADINSIRDGNAYAQGGVNYLARVSQGLMGKAVYFTKQ